MQVLNIQTTANTDVYWTKCKTIHHISVQAPGIWRHEHYLSVQSPTSATVQWQALCLPVDIVSEEQVVGTWWISTFVKMSQQVLVLAVNVATYVNRSTKLYEHRLREKYVAWQHAQLTNVRLRQLYLQSDITGYTLERTKSASCCKNHHRHQFCKLNEDCCTDPVPWPWQIVCLHS